MFVGRQGSGSRKLPIWPTVCRHIAKAHSLAAHIGGMTVMSDRFWPKPYLLRKLKPTSSPRLGMLGKTSATDRHLGRCKADFRISRCSVSALLPFDAACCLGASAVSLSTIRTIKLFVKERLRSNMPSLITFCRQCECPAIDDSLARTPALQQQRIRHHAHAAERHCRTCDHGVEQAECGSGNANHVVNERPEQILPNLGVGAA